ncbi:MAG TPA: GTPase ObgE, partial [Candidatus Dormibacteraeota bacterium]|nr:GTPase ObgE [Candidatus Dormibacteraeota bacterium]
LKQKKHGRNGKDVIIKVPVGTVITDSENNVLADLTADDQSIVIAPGGRGGFGNAHFVSSVRQAPGFAEKGEVTSEKKLDIELKIIAEVGLIGLPNAGKSTLLGSLSNAKPEIADYPFTTLTPNLGVVDVDPQTSLLFADIPGIIEGASRGKGLGIDFLKHIERTVVLVHLIDAYSDDLYNSYFEVKAELKAYDIDLTKKPELIVVSKIDGLDKELLNQKLADFKKKLVKKSEVYAISSLTKEGIGELLAQLKVIVLKQRAKQTRANKKVANQLPVITLSPEKTSWEIIADNDSYKILGYKIEQFASRTDFTNSQSVARLRDILKKMGIIRELQRKGVRDGDKIEIGNIGQIEY